MISIFNGRERTLGGSTSEIFAQVNVDFRQHLHLLKGAPLAVFLAISLHANEHGWAWPSRDTLARETGYNPQTVSRALSDLCKIEINGQRLILRYQPQTGNSGTFDSNQYLIFPSPAEVIRYEGAQMELPCVGFASTVEPSTVGPSTVEPSTVNLHTKKNHLKQEPAAKEEPYAKEEEEASSNNNNKKGEHSLSSSSDHDSSLPICSIHQVPMHLCKAKDGTGDTWYAHRQPNGRWCKGPIMAPPPEEHKLTIEELQEQRLEELRQAEAAQQTPEFWQRTLAELELQMDKGTFTRFIYSTAERSNGTITVLLHNKYAARWVASRLDDVVKTTLARVIGEPVNVTYQERENEEPKAAP